MSEDRASQETQQHLSDAGPLNDADAAEDAQHDEEDGELWSDAGATRLLAAADALAQEVRAHALALTAAGQVPPPAVFAAERALLPALREQVHALFAYTHCGSLLGGLDALWEEEDSDEDDADGEDDEDEELVGEHIAVLRRQDYQVLDPAAVMAAGRAAYAQLHPDASPGEAAADVSHLGRAIYQLTHLGGFDALGDVEGLDVVGATARTVRTATPLVGDPDDWPQDPFEQDGPLLHSEDDIYLS